MQYLYDSGDDAVFMDNRDYEQIELPGGLRPTPSAGRRPTTRLDILFVDDQPTDVQVERGRAEGDHDRARGQGRHRLRRRQQGRDARVRGHGSGPALHRRGRMVRVDTRSGEYVSRA